MKRNLRKKLTELLKELHLPMFREYHAEYAVKAMSEGLSYEQYLFELAQIECDVRRANKIIRLIKASKLPMEKTLENFDLKRLPLRIRQQVKILLEGSFVDRTENLLAFGNPGSGKTHLLCGLCHELARQGRRVYFSTCDSIVQQLLRAKRDLELDKLLKKLSRFDALMIDDFGYVKQDRDEMEVLFTLLAHRYERGSMLITSNLPFSKWEVIFKDPMTTAAAIDRLVHHSVVLELNVPSYRAEQA
ncbi:MAG: ATP-binding protein, partial [Gammaproteobacteria bacterium]|nr:ATP-binding protein [Gammaproteobacteria bacterium]NIQ74770.1 ATP-binding protein [Gammaproteobacteria bacterium]